MLDTQKIKRRTPAQAKAQLERVKAFAEKYPELSLSSICSLALWAKGSMCTAMVEHGIMIFAGEEGVEEVTAQKKVYSMFLAGDTEGIQSFSEDVQELQSLITEDDEDLEEGYANQASDEEDVSEDDLDY